MKQRIAIRLFSIFSLGLLAFAFASACASEQTTDPFISKDASVQGTGGGNATGSCDPTFCQAVGTGAGCCVAANGPCGVNYGMGCIPLHRDGG
jgi:hypothetical protein